MFTENQGLFIMLILSLLVGPLIGMGVFEVLHPYDPPVIVEVYSLFALGLAWVGLGWIFLGPNGFLVEDNRLEI